MKSIIYIVLGFLITIVLCECKNEPKKITQNSQKITDTTFKTIADTIISDIVIKNPNNDNWTAYCLRNLQKDSFINDLFDLVYSKKITPYDFFTGEKMSVRDIKKLERKNDYKREDCAKIQFEENWKFDKENQKMIKEVISIMVAYQFYDSKGNVKGYKPIFKVYL
ncbi:MAG: hypothetical protein MI739_08780 [Bacteroidales bacterium]|nr:hypothetical protein [Bacteroidales bacterium]